MENHHALQKSIERKVPVEERIIDNDILSNKKTVIEKEVNAKYNIKEEDKLTHMDIKNQKTIQNCEILDTELNAEKGDEKQIENENKAPTISNSSQTRLRNTAGHDVNEDTKRRMELELGYQRVLRK